jgi:hypothetical protein
MSPSVPFSLFTVHIHNSYGTSNLPDGAISVDDPNVVLTSKDQVYSLIDGMINRVWPEANVRDMAQGLAQTNLAP